MGRIVKGYWDCKYCGTKKIDGLTDVCPNCGKQKSEDVKYYMDGQHVYVTDEELSSARILKSDCDGKHPDWVCPYCSQLNNYRDDVCVACGGQKSESERNYQDAAEPDYHVDTGTHNKPEPMSGKALRRIPIKGIGILLSIIMMIVLCVLGFYPIKKTVTVTGFSWERSIIIQEERTVAEDDWSVPPGGRVYDTREEIRGYESVLDHYETRYETKTREVYDHDEVYYTYEDNGNGTFTEIEHSSPVYRTETYTEPYQEPVYRQEPVWDTKYYYEIERWFDADTYESSDDDKNPYWNSDYKLSPNQRDTKRYETYLVHYSDGTQDEVPYTEWNNIAIGDGYEITYCRLGIVYKKQSIVCN